MELCWHSYSGTIYLYATIIVNDSDARTESFLSKFADVKLGKAEHTRGQECNSEGSWQMGKLGWSSQDDAQC